MHANMVNYLNFPCSKHLKSTPQNKITMLLTLLKWFARVLAILTILFMLMFSLDAFSGEETFARKMLGFLMHNIPVFALIIALVIAWRYEIAGGVIYYLICGVGYLLQILCRKQRFTDDNCTASHSRDLLLLCTG